MADIEYGGFNDGFGGSEQAYRPLLSPRKERLVNLAGAVSSVVLLAGAVWWGVDLAFRDVSGVPVMRALDGPMRVAPANPGGDVVSGKGLSVNAVAAMGTATPLPDTLYLAPPPIALTEEDEPGLAPPLVGTVADGESAAVAAAENPLIATGMAPGETALSTDDAVAAALNEALLADLGAVTPGLTTSPRPKPRGQGGVAGPSILEVGGTALAPAAISAGAVEAVATTEPAAPTGPVPAEIDRSTLAEGTRLVQIDAFDTVEAAHDAWARVSERFPDLMATKSLVIEPAQSGGRVFYRVRAHGFANDEESRAFCSTLQAGDVNCIPVTHRKS